MFYLCIEPSLLYLSVGAMRGCVVAVAVCVASRGGCAWVRLVCLLPVLMYRVLSCSDWVRPTFFLWVRSLCFSESVSARMGNGPNQSIPCLL